MSLAFSGSQEWLVSLGSESLQCVVLYRSLNRFWDDAQVVCSAQVALGKFIWTQFIDGNEISIAVGGTCGALYFFRRKGHYMKRKKASFGQGKSLGDDRRDLPALLCATDGVLTRILSGKNSDSEKGYPAQNNINVGAGDGRVYRWSGRLEDCIASFECHQSPVFAICRCVIFFPLFSQEAGANSFEKSMNIIDNQLYPYS